MNTFVSFMPPEPEPEPEAESQQLSSESPFLKLPLDIRFGIYQFLLLADGPIPGLNSGPGGHRPSGLHPSIIATCSQIRRESQPILYEQNVVQVDLFSFLDICRTYFETPATHATPLPRLEHLRFQNTKSFEIVYEGPVSFLTVEDFWEIRKVSREACRFMSQLSGIRFVSLNLTGISSKAARMTILKAWLQLRNVGRAAVDAGGLSMKEDVVKEFMTVATTKSHVPRMLSALERFAKLPVWADRIFDVAQSSLENGSPQVFASFAKDLIQGIDKHLEEARNILKKYDIPPRPLPRPPPVVDELDLELEFEPDSGFDSELSLMKI